MIIILFQYIVCIFSFSIHCIQIDVTKINLSELTFIYEQRNRFDIIMANVYECSHNIMTAVNM